MMPHKKYMEMALKLAQKGRGYTSPNPMVGCIIVKRGKIVGRGYHKKAGEEHAEISALHKASKRAINSTMYINLEPCSHWGKTPPCTETIVEKGVREVVIAMYDPNPKVDGYKELKFRGTKTKIGILEKEAKKINEFYIKYIKTKRPFVIVKVVMSLDGKIATSTGKSKYITGREARTYVHNIKSGVDALMVDINTALNEKTLLTTKSVKGKDPIKIIVDSKLKISLKPKLIKGPSKLIIATTQKAPKKKIKMLQQKGVNVLITKNKMGKVDLKDLMKQLGKLEITGIMIEEGSDLNAYAIKEGIVDKVMFFSAPKLIGNGLSALGNLGIKKLNKAINLKHITTTKMGKDILIEGYL